MAAGGFGASPSSAHGAPTFTGAGPSGDKCAPVPAHVAQRAGAACGSRARTWVAVEGGTEEVGLVSGGAMADTERCGFRPGMGAVGAPRNEAGRAHARSAFGAAVVVIIVMIVGSLAKPRFLVGPAGALPQLMLPAGTTRADSVRAATAAASAMVSGGGESFLVANVVRASDAGLSQMVHVVARPLLGAALEATLRSAARSGQRAVKLELLQGHHDDFAARATHFMLSTMVARPAPALPVLAPNEIDRGPGRRARWEQALVVVDAADALLGAALGAVQPDDPDHAYLAGWLRQLAADGRPLMENVPLDVRAALEDAVHPDLLSVPMSKRYTPVTTTRVPRQSAQRAAGYEPRSIADILEPDAVAAIHDWEGVELSNLAAARALGNAAPNCARGGGSVPFGSCVRPHKALIIGQSQFQERARGIVWDCRPWSHKGQDGRPAPGPAVPLDFRADPSSALNIDWIEAHSAEWPDKELLGFLRDGVNFRAKLPLAFLFSPHLRSLGDGVASVEKELRRLDEAGYHTIHDALPFAPTRFMSQGCTARKLEPDRKRRTTDGGCPRDVAYDADGNQCVSINDAIGLKSTAAEAAEFDAAHLGHEADGAAGAEAGSASGAKWKQAEIKPRIEDKMFDDTLLRAAATQAFHQHLYGFADDFKDYYQQMPLASSQRWVSGLVWQQLDVGEREASGGRAPVCIAEQRLGFGISLSSNLGQRLAELILSVFRDEFDREENARFDAILPVGGACVGDGFADALTRSASGYTDVCRWIARRRTLSMVTGNNEVRAYAVHQYTDDAAFTCIGAERTVRALRCWHRVTAGFGLPMAIDAKRQVGTRLLWLGMEWHVSLGLLVLQQAKVQRAAEALDLIISGAHVTTFDTYRSLLGLFEHLLAFSEGDRTMMDHLYADNFRRGYVIGPLAQMVFGDPQLKTLRRWRRLLLRATGCACSAALRLASVARPRLPERLRDSTLFVPRPRGLDEFYLYSDAASDARGAGGLGGWVHGEWWHLKLTSEDKELFHITVLELIAAGINVVVYGDLLGGCDVTLCVDALSSAQLIAAGHSRSEAMAVVWSLIQATPQYSALRPLLREAHVYGEANVMSDASSREKFEVISDVAEQCGVVATRVPLPQRALDFVEAVRVATRHLRAEKLHAARVGAHYDEKRPGPPPARAASAEELVHMQAREKARSDNEDGDAVPPVLQALGWSLGQPTLAKRPAGNEAADGFLVKRQTSVAALPGDPARPFGAWSSCGRESAAWKPLGGAAKLGASKLSQGREAERQQAGGWLDSAVAPAWGQNRGRSVAGVRPAAQSLSPAGAATAQPARPGDGSVTTFGAWNCLRDAAGTAPGPCVTVGLHSVREPAAGAPADRPFGSWSASLRAPISSGYHGVPPEAIKRGAPKAAAAASILDVLRSPDIAPRGELHDTLVADSSEYALRPADPALLYAYAQAVGYAVTQAVRPGTRKKNLCAMSHWRTFTGIMGTPALRRDPVPNLVRETFLVGAFIVWLTTILKPKTKGRAFCKPESYMAHAYGVKRAHMDLGIQFDVLFLARSVFRTLCDEYGRRHGPECMIPARREPFARHMLKTMLDVPSGLRVGVQGTPTLVWSSWFGLNYAAMMCVSASGGFRKAEVSLGAGVSFDAMHLSRAHLFWIINGIIHRAPSRELLMSMRGGDLAGLVACPCKNDPTGSAFMPHPLYFSFRPGDRFCTAWRLREMVINCWVEPEVMRTTPLFSTGPSRQPFRHSVVDKVLLALLLTFLPEAEAARYSWHSWRIGLACSLLAAGASEATILALCRWKGPQSLRIYARRNKHDIAAWVDTAEAQILDSVQAPNLPGLGIGAPAATAATAWPAAAALVPGALPGDTYALLATLENAAEPGLAAAALRALVDFVPEIDGDAWMRGVGVAADRPDSPGAEDHDGGSGDDVGSDDEDDGGIETFGDVALS